MNYEQRQEFENLLISYLLNNPDEAKLILKIFIDIALLTKWLSEDIVFLLNNCREYCSDDESVVKEIDFWLDDSE